MYRQLFLLHVQYVCGVCVCVTGATTFQVKINLMQMSAVPDGAVSYCGAQGDTSTRTHTRLYNEILNK